MSAVLYGQRAQLLRRLLDQRLERRGGARLVPQPRTGALPLSFAQQRLWFLDRLLADRASYNIPAAWRLAGPLDVAALENALSQVVARHGVLRARFEDVEGEPLQTIDPVRPAALEHRDLSGLATTEREARAWELAMAHARELFDLTRGPLLRSILMRLGEHEHLLVVTAHHIVSDGWSMGVLRRELGALYEGANLAPLPIQYADYAAWQREWLQGEALSLQVAYWKKRLAALPVLALPTDRKRPALPSYQGARITFDVPATVTQSLRGIGQHEGATLFMVLLAAWQVLLARYSGQYDVAVGTPIAGRTRSELEGLIGFFANTLVLRCDLSGEPGFTQLLRQVCESALEAYAYQDVPFEKLVEELKPERDLSRNPLVQVLFSLQNTPGEALALAGIEARAERLDTGTAKMDLTLTLTEHRGALQGEIEYACDLFDSGSIQRMAGHFERLLQAIVADPQLPIGRLILLSPAEREQQLVAWNDTAVEYDSGACIHQLFEAQAARAPDALALMYEERRMSYSELDAQANALAQQLRALGVGPDVLVGLCLERSLALIVAVLGILKAGGAYVPLDPELPSERLAFMLEDTQAAVLVTHSCLLSLLPHFTGKVVLIDSDDPQPGSGMDGDASSTDLQFLARADVTPNPQSLANIIYTSGSTGKPKGVAVTHRGVVRLFEGADYVRFGPAQRFMLLSPVSFDAFNFELWGALLHGASCVLMPGRVPEVDKLGTLLKRHGITTLWLPTSLFNLVIDEAPEILAGVSQLVTGGEAMSVLHARRALVLLPGLELINVYGPTETTTFACCYQLPRPLPEAWTSIPIGKPIASTRTYVLDVHGGLCPPGVEGELHIAGERLARGYLGRPQLTAERFVPDPYAPASGGRMYRTGDRVRQLTDGKIEFIGRLDGQIKLRGFRIEPGEIERVLLRHPHIQAALVHLREDAPDDKRLVAYLVTRGPMPAAGELRAMIAQELPEYMIPAAFVHLPQMPLNANGKIDRKALPAPRLENSAAQGAQPPSLMEGKVAALWCELLRLERVGAEDNFFEIGGHSLLATRMLSRLAKQLNTELSLRDLFDAPTVTAFAARAQQALGTRAATMAGPVRPGFRQGVLLPSFAQQRLWLLDGLLADRASYNIPSAWRLAGPLAVGALAHALSQVVARHEALRTRLEAIEGELIQIIEPARLVALEQCDLSGISITEREGRANAMAKAHAREPFDLSRGPLLRSLLLRLGEQEHLLMVTVHHVASDGWSMGVMWRELGALYAGEALAPLPIQYADYAAWQREWLQGDALALQVAYWKERLTGLEPLALPTDRQRPAVPSQRGARVAFDVPAAVAQPLREIGQREGATLFMVLLAAWQVLLSRYSGQHDVAVGTPIAGRTRSELEDLIGFFANTLVLRCDLSGESSFTQVLRQVRERALEAYAHQDIPFEKLVEELKPERDLSRNPLVQVMFALQNTPPEDLALTGIVARAERLDTGTAKMDLTLTLTERDGGLQGELGYASDLFDTETVERMATHFGRLLQAIVANPQLPTDLLALLSPAEREQQLLAWNDTAIEYDSGACIHQLFEAQAARAPDALALMYEERRMSYSELNARADALAQRLRALGVGPDVLVGLCLERSPELIVAVLGILKAGGAYVPLDPAHPSERLAFMLEDTQAAVLVAHSGMLAKLPSFAGEVICIDGDDPQPGVDMDRDDMAITPKSAADPDTSMNSRSLAYVLFTSGSTGKPKGVMIEHRSLVNYVQWLQREFTLAASDRVLQTTPVSFDISILEIFWPLHMGAQVVISPPGTQRSVQEVVGLVRDRHVTVMQLVPSMLGAVVQEAGFGSLPSLRRVFTAGEALGIDTVQRFHAQSPAELVNGYGPTETTVYSTFWRCDRATRGSAIPIGRPLANTRILILDPHGTPVPIGVSGELHIGGEGLARGYLRRPELTAQRFVRDPYASSPDVRMYRTGDGARYRADGTIEFLGRLDGQIKLRGYRIEPGEIEAALLSHADVRAAVVQLRGDTALDQRLVAYLVTRGDPPPIAELRTMLRQSLPDYMVPAAFVQIERMPLNANGKIDHKQLPPPPGEAAQSRGASARDPLEEAVATLWCELLKLDHVGIHDDFFEIGGHSLLATRLISRLTDLLKVELTLAELFDHPTVAGLAAQVQSRFGTKVAGSRVPVRAVARDRPLPMSFGQRRLWFLDQLVADKAAYHSPIAWRLRGRLDVAALERGLTALVARHEALRTRFEMHGRATVQIIEPASEAEMQRADLRTLAPPERKSEARRLLTVQARQPFDLQQGPLIRAHLLHLDEDDHLLLLNLHHIAFDGWSMEVLCRDLAALYAGAADALPVPPALPALSVQYADYSVWQHERLQSAAMAHQLAYWKNQLAALPTLELPTDKPRPPQPSYRGARVAFDIPAPLTHKLHELARSEGATLFMTLLAAFQLLLARYSGQSDIAVGTPIAGRTCGEVEGLIGFFVNTLVLRGDLSGEPSVKEFLGRVRRTALEAYAHQEVPFEKLIEELNPVRDLSRNPLAQVMFMLHNKTGSGLALAGIQATPIRLETGTAKFDLTLSLSEVASGLHGALEYALDLFEEETATRMAQDFSQLLEAVVADPALSTVGLLSLEGQQSTQRLPPASAATPLAQQSTPAGQDAADEIEWGLCQVWAQVLGVEKVGVDESFFELGGHSLSAIRLVAEMRSQLRLEVRVAALFQAPTVRQLAVLLRDAALRGDHGNHGENANASSLVAVQPLGTRPALFVVPGAGGEMFSLHHLSGMLGPDQPMYVMNLFGIGKWPSAQGAQGELDVRAIAVRIIADIRQICPEGPYHLMGYSLGCRIVYEMAQQLHRAGVGVGSLVLLDSGAPGFARLSTLPGRVLGVLRRGLAMNPLQALRAAARRANFLLKPAERKYDIRTVFPDADDLPVNDIASFQHSLDLVFRALALYRAEPYPGLVVLVRTPTPGLRWIEASVEDRTMGWGRWATAGVVIEIMACMHEEILTAPQAPVLAGILQKYLSAPSQLRGEAHRDSSP